MNTLRVYWKNTSADTRLWIIALGSGLVYLAFTLPFPLNRYYVVNPPVDYAKLTRHSALGFTAYFVGIILLFILSVIGLRILARSNNIERNIRFVLMTGGIFAIILIFSYPQTAIDLFINAIRSRAWALYGLSPFITSPEVIPPSDPWVGLAGEWADIASPYGPIWELLSLGAYYLSGGGFLNHLFAIKILCVLAYIGSVWLVYRIILEIRPEWAVVGAAFFAWNPLVLFESVQNAHNDIVMVFFLLAAIWAFVQLMQATDRRKKLWYSGIFVLAFVVSILVKFVTVMVLPFFLLTLALRQKTWSQRIFLLAAYGLAVAGLLVLFMWPYWPGFDNWAVLDVGEGAGRSLMALLILVLRPIIGTNQAFDITKSIIYIGLGLLYLWCLWLVWMKRYQRSQRESTLLNSPLDRSIFAGFAVLFGYALFGASTFHAWYFLWCLPLAALLIPAIRTTSVAWTSSLAALLIIPYFETIRVWIPSLNQNHLLGHAIGVPLLLIPVLLALWKPLRILPEEIRT
jgi:ABC-type multidrug transport system fused ATPase/permease subunit